MLKLVKLRLSMNSKKENRLDNINKLIRDGFKNAKSGKLEDICYTGMVSDNVFIKRSEDNLSIVEIAIVSENNEIKYLLNGKHINSKDRIINLYAALTTNIIDIPDAHKQYIYDELYSLGK